MGWTQEQLDGWREVGDPAADAVVRSLFAAGEVDDVNALMVNLRRTDDPLAAGLPSVLRDFLADTSALPPWADTGAIERSQRLFQTFGLQISLCLFCASLPSAYAAAKGVKVLYLTARLDTDTRRRIMETGQFLMDVLAPGSFEPDRGTAIRSIQRVRLMHAGIRSLIHARDATAHDWDPAWGEPLNQEDLAGTLMSFAFVVGEPLPRMGVKLEAAQCEDYIHAWNVVGHLLGIRDELLPADMAQAQELVTAIRQRQFASSPEGKVMTTALVSFLEDSSPTFGRLRIVPAMIRQLIGDATADLVDVPDETPESWRVLGPVRAVFGWLATRVARDRVLRDLAEPLAREVLHGVFDHERGGIRAPFAIPEELARTWTIDPLSDVRGRPKG